MTSPTRTDVLICRAGLTGLFLAHALARHGVAARLVDRHAGPAEHSRAVGSTPAGASLTACTSQAASGRACPSPT